MAGERAAGVVQKARRLHRGSADNDEADAEVEILFDGVEVADAAAQLHRNRTVDRIEYGLDAGLILRLAGGGAIEIDHMQAAGALLDPLRCHRTGVVGKNRGVIHVALFQAHTFAVLEINRRDDQHAA